MKDISRLTQEQVENCDHLLFGLNKRLESLPFSLGDVPNEYSIFRGEHPTHGKEMSLTEIEDARKILAEHGFIGDSNGDRFPMRLSPIARTKTFSEYAEEIRNKAKQQEEKDAADAEHNKAMLASDRERTDAIKGFKDEVVKTQEKLAEIQSKIPESIGEVRKELKAVGSRLESALKRIEVIEKEGNKYIKSIPESIDKLPDRFDKLRSGDKWQWGIGLIVVAIFGIITAYQQKRSISISNKQYALDSTIAAMQRQSENKPSNAVPDSSGKQVANDVNNNSVDTFHKLGN